jgi:hypothetical protein
MRSARARTRRDRARIRPIALTRGDRARIRPIALIGATLAAFVTFASPAGAATVAVDGSLLRIAAAAGESNQLSVTADPSGSLVVTDAGAPLTAGPGCTQTDTGVTCVTPVDVTIDVFAGDRDDSVTVGVTAGSFVDGGAGSDVVDVANGGSDSVWCSGGSDTVTAELLDSLDLRCERVDYGPAGSVGRLRWITGGGRRVVLPGQGWVLVDGRILADVLYLIRRYHVRITEGFGTVGHSHFGEHPLGLAVDIEPGAGGTWDDVSRLARWAEPRQNRPRAPFRFVGWNGDFNHGHPSICKRRLGCAPHLHLSWDHSPTPPRGTARSVRVFEVR